MPEYRDEGGVVVHDRAHLFRVIATVMSEDVVLASGQCETIVDHAGVERVGVADVVVGRGQDEGQAALLPEPQQQVLHSAARTLVSLQEEDVGAFRLL